MRVGGWSLLASGIVLLVLGIVVSGTVDEEQNVVIKIGITNF